MKIEEITNLLIEKFSDTKNMENEKKALKPSDKNTEEYANLKDGEDSFQDEIINISDITLENLKDIGFKDSNSNDGAVEDEFLEEEKELISRNEDNIKEEVENIINRYKNYNFSSFKIDNDLEKNDSITKDDDNVKTENIDNENAFLANDDKDLKDKNHIYEIKVIDENSENVCQKDTKDEEYFLLALKERILVLFEGLNAFDKNDIEARVELNLKFMEFLLANIDNRLEYISK